MASSPDLPERSHRRPYRQSRAILDSDDISGDDIDPPPKRNPTKPTYGAQHTDEEEQGDLSSQSLPEPSTWLNASDASFDSQHTQHSDRKTNKSSDDSANRSNRRRNHNDSQEQDCDDIDQEVPEATQAALQSEDLDDPLVRDNPYALAAKQSYDSLVKLIFEQETAEKRAALRELERDDFINAGVEILCMMVTPVLVELMGGNLPHAAYLDPDLKETLRVMKKRSEAEHPGIYVRFLVDDTGLSPTPKELREIVQKLRGYAELDNGLDEKKVRQIDRAMPWNSPMTNDPAVRRYLSQDIPNKDFTLMPTRVEAIDTFTTELLKNLDEITDDKQDSPFPTPLVYVGYAKNCMKRNTEYHDKHKSSNFLMDLTEAVALTNLKGRYRMRWHVVVLLPAPALVAGAEIIISAIAKGYTTTGTGFAHHSAGESTSSHELGTRNDKTVGIDPTTWQGHLKWVLKNTPYTANAEAQAKHCLARVEEYEQLKADIAAEEAEQRALAIQKLELAIGALRRWHSLTDTTQKISTALTDLPNDEEL